MKKYLFYWAVHVMIWMSVCFACNKESEPEYKEQEPVITMTTKASILRFFMTGDGDVTINWGDGTASETHALSNILYNGPSYAHNYSEIAAHTIKISGGIIEMLLCDDIQLTFLDASRCTELNHLSCQTNQLTSLDVSKNLQLTNFFCRGNQIASLDVSKNTQLVYLDCVSNSIKSLDVSNNSLLYRINCQNNQLDHLDVSMNPGLEYLDCYNNQLTTLYLGNNTVLRDVWCYNNQLTIIEVNDNTGLRMLSCRNNQLIMLDVSGNTALRSVDCRDNQLSAAAMDDFFETLHDFNTLDFPDIGFVSIGGNPGAADCKRNIAENKGWTVLY